MDSLVIIIPCWSLLLNCEYIMHNAEIFDIFVHFYVWLHLNMQLHPHVACGLCFPSSMYICTLYAYNIILNVTCSQWISIFNTTVVDDFPAGKKLHGSGAPGDFAPFLKCKKEPSKIKRELLKIAIDCNVKACSVFTVQCCRFSQWDVKSSPRK